MGELGTRAGEPVEHGDVAAGDGTVPLERVEHVGDSADGMDREHVATVPAGGEHAVEGA